MDEQQGSDLQLAKHAASGDETALTEFYGRYADPLYAYIYHHVGDPRSDVEDLWQDTLLCGLQSLSTYRGQSRLFTWLCGIARHKIADHYRHRGRSSTDVFSDVSEVHLAALVSSTPLPEEVITRRATRLRVVEALAVLRDDYREALAARYAEGQSVGQVAESLGRSYKATESLLSRARAAFKVALAGLEEEV